MERGRTTEYASILRWEISFTRDGSVSVMVSMAGLSVAKEHLGEAATDERRAVLVFGHEFRHHVRLAAALVLVDDLAAGARAHAGPDRLQELEVHLRVKPRVHDIAAVAHPQGLVPEQGGVRDGAPEGRVLEEPGMVILHREGVRLDVFGGDEMLVRDELLADLERLVSQLLELDHRGPPLRVRGTGWTSASNG